METERVADFLFFTRRLEKCLFAVKGREGEKLSLKGIHILCLFFLCAKGPMSVMELARATQEDKGAVSKALEKLRRTNFVEAKKRYMEPIRLTRHGEVEAARLMHRIQRIAEAAREGINQDEADAFIKTLRAYVCNFDRAILASEAKSAAIA